MDSYVGNIQAALPSGEDVLVEEMTVKNVNLMLSSENPSVQTYNMLSTGLQVLNGDEKIIYDPRNAWAANNFAGMVLKREATLGKEYEFGVRCSSPNCEYGRSKRGGKEEFFMVHLGDVYLDSETNEEVENPYRIQPIIWEEPGKEPDGKTVFGADKASGRFLVYLTSMKITVVTRLLKGQKDDTELRKINTHHRNQRASKLIQLRTVGIIGEEIKGKKDSTTDWRKANYERVPHSFFENLGYSAWNEYNDKYNIVEGGIDTDFNEECPLCQSPLETLEGDTQVPFLARGFFTIRRHKRSQKKL